MEKYVITIDTGTTNTRTILWDAQRNCIATQKRSVGVRNTAIDGNDAQLKKAVRECLETLLAEEGINYDSVGKIIASGMITSNVGLVEIPHIVAPASIEDLAAASKEVLLEEVCPLPICFIPGVKNFAGSVNFENLDTMDIMRGEEVESCAIIDRFPAGTPMLLILPGSHTKFVSVNARGEITGCLTTISGELLAAITTSTIIADAVNRTYVEEDTYDRDALLKGYDIAKANGLSRACFSTRILHLFLSKDPAQAANFLMGAVLQTDIAAMQASDIVGAGNGTLVVVAGKNPLRQALVDILEYENTGYQVQSYQPEGNIPLSALGAYVIAQRGNLL